MVSGAGRAGAMANVPGPVASPSVDACSGFFFGWSDDGLRGPGWPCSSGSSDCHSSVGEVVAAGVGMVSEVYSAVDAWKA